MAAGKGETDLQKLLSSLKLSQRPETFVFLTFSLSTVVPLTLNMQMQFREQEGLTVITTKESAEAHGLAYEMPSSMITCEVHSALEAVGFMANISRVLADKGIPCNVVAGFFHDHLFVPVEQADAAMKALAVLASSNLAAS